MKAKRLFVLSALLLTLQFQSRAQTASNYIAQGRAYLTVSNLVAANLSFSNALFLSPTDPTGNVLYAATQLLILPSQPAGSNFLTQLGVPIPGRNIYDWTANLPEDANGVPLAPAGVNATNATSLLHSNILGVVIAAEANLAMVTNTNFTLALTAQETASVAVTLDYGDIQLLRAMLDGFEYFIYNTYDWNLNVQLTVFRSFYSGNTYSINGLLAAYPSLLTFASTNDLSSAESAFLNAENRYQPASQFIRGRPPGTVRLFNYDPGEEEREANFRLTIADMANSLTNGLVTLEANSNYSVFMPADFSGAHSIRSFLPSFSGDGFVAGSLPDPTFGGVIYGLTGNKLESRLANLLTPIPNILSATAPAWQFPIHGIVGHGYVVQASTNLVNWSNVTAFVSSSGTNLFTDPAGHNLPRRFYRVVDRTADMPTPPNDNFANRIPLTGLEIQTNGYDEDATVENGEPGYGEPSVWWSWTAPSSGLVIVSTAGSTDYAGVKVYTGTTLASLVAVPAASGNYNGYAFNASIGTTYQIQVFGYAYGNPGAIQLEIGVPPVLSVSSPTNNAVLTAPNNITITASASETQGTIASVQYSVSEEFSPGASWSGSSAGSSLNVTLTNMPSGNYYIMETATDVLGISTFAGQTVTVIAPQVTTTTVPNGTNGVAYSLQLTAINGHLPYSWSLISGSLPPGLNLAANGVISGTPTNNGTFNFTVQVSDTLSESGTQALTLTVGSSPSNVAIQPTNNPVTVPVGGNVSLTVSVSGTGPFSYRWQFNGTNLLNGIITTVAGNGNEGFSGDGGPATSAEFILPSGVAVDTTGNLFIADSDNSRIRKVGVNGIITTVAGNGIPGFFGDGGLATNAELSYPFGVAVDAKGNLFIADFNNSRIRKVGTNGIITTLAGKGGGGYTGDRGLATNATLNYPNGVAVDSIGNVFIADTSNNVIRMVGTNGIITTVAGNGYGAGAGFGGYSGDGGAATNAELNYPYGVAVDANRNLFIADSNNGRVRKVGTNGIIITVAGGGTGGLGDGGAATNAELSATGVALDAIGNLFIANGGNNRIRKVDTNGIITTVAGNGYGTATSPPWITSGGYSGDGGAATNAELYFPTAVAVDGIENLYIADYDNNRIRKVVNPNNPDTGPTLALSNVGFTNAGAYDVVVSGPYGNVTSSVVNLIVTIPVILSAPQITNGSPNFTFLLSGPAGSNYVLQASTNLVNWSPVNTSMIPISGTVSLSNPTTGFNRRFYRVAIGP